MQNYCYQCMRQLKGTPICPHCGFNNAKAQSLTIMYHLPMGTMLTGRYLVGRVLGEGGFGITYIGLDTTLTKRVAIKEFYPSGAANRTNTISTEVLVSQGREGFFSKGVERFLFEAKNVAAFSEEEGIVDVLDYFQANGTAYIVMEFLNGETLKDYVNRNGCFKLEKLVDLMIPVMHSLATIHAKGIIHRDISPDNIMLTKRGKLKLMDFGSARYYTNEERKMSVILKQGFAPEEQYRQNGEQGPHTDVYALCATMYACITGRVPVSSLDRLVEDSLQPPSQLGVPVLPYQERALMHGLALSMKNRTPDMETLAKEFTSKPAVEPERVVKQELKVDRTIAAETIPEPKKVRQSDKTDIQKKETKDDAAQPSFKKSKKPILLIAAIVAVLAIGGGIFAGVSIFGNKGSEAPVVEYSAADTGSAAASQNDSVSKVTAKAESAVSTTVSQSSAVKETSAASSKAQTDYHSMYEGNIVDDRLDTADVSAELTLRSHTGDLTTEVPVENVTVSVEAVGNALVAEYRFKSEPTDAERQSAQKAAEQLKTSAQSDLKNLRSQSGNSNVQLVYVFLDQSGDFIAGTVVNG